MHSFANTVSSVPYRRPCPCENLKNVPGARKSAPPTGWNAAAGSVTAASRPAATAMRTLLTIWNCFRTNTLSLPYVSRQEHEVLRGCHTKICIKIPPWKVPLNNRRAAFYLQLKSKVGQHSRQHCSIAYQSKCGWRACRNI
jgi:hypothetical protein